MTASIPLSDREIRYIKIALKIYHDRIDENLKEGAENIECDAYEDLLMVEHLEKKFKGIKRIDG